MSGRAVLRPAIVKEVRAAWPILAAALGAMIVSAFGGRYRGLGMLAYAVGAASLGSFAVGHEFSYRTIQTLLTVPQSRRTTMVLKLVVLIMCLLPLAAVGRFLTFHGYDAERDPEMTVVFWLPLATAVGVAPWLTMLFRSATAGMAFSLAMPGFMFCGALVAWAATRGFTPVPQSFVFGVGWTGTLLISVVGGILGWRAFQRLEPIDGGESFGRPSWLGRDPKEERREPRRFRPEWLLVRKELRLQRMTFVAAAGYAVMLLLLVAARPSIPDEVAEVMTAFYIGLLPFMPGALASAEEHQLGTVEWQMSLPMAGWKQWLVKVGVVVTVACGLAIGVPAALGTIPEQLLYARGGVAVLALVAGSLYVSSATRSSLWALLTAIGAMVVTAPLLAWTASVLSFEPGHLPALGTRLVVGLAVAGTVLTLAMFNHRRAGSAGWRQAAAAVGCAACSVVALSLIV
jgi:hypothetical protein